MARALLVAYYFPPLGGIGSLRAVSQARHLPEHGWDVDVLAPRSGAYHRDEQLEFPEQHVVRTASLELSRIGKKALHAGGDDLRPAQVDGTRRVLRQAAHAVLYFPDAQVGWAPFALRAGRRALSARPVDAIVSSSFPITAHIVARRLAREAGVPWIAEFRDPWSELMAPGRRRRRAARLERALARDASAVVMTSPSWAERHARLWGRSVDVIPNGHDLGAVRADAPTGLVLGYLGTYYPGAQASLAPVWEAASRLGDDQGGPHVEEIRIVGELHPAMRAELAAHGLADRIRVTGFLSHEEAVQRIASCSVAVLAGPSDADGVLRGHVPGKVWEYLATDLPVVCVAAPQSDVASLMRQQVGTHLVSLGDAAGAASALRAATARRHERDATAHSRRARAGDLADALDRAIADR